MPINSLLDLLPPFRYMPDTTWQYVTWKKEYQLPRSMSLSKSSNTAFPFPFFFLPAANDQRYCGRACGLTLLLLPVLICSGSHHLGHRKTGELLKLKCQGVLHLSIKVQLAASPLLPLPLLKSQQLLCTWWADTLRVRPSAARQQEQPLPLDLLPAP